MTEAEFDRIERSVDIDAPAERVYALVSEAGWFINDDAIVEHRIDIDGDLHTVHDPVHGAFVFREVELRPHEFAAYRWLEDAADPSSPSTLVEFTITPRAGGVTLTVVESGFAALSGDAVARRERYDGNVRGWQQELDLARQLLSA